MSLTSGHAVVVLGQAFDLLDVEDGVALHEGDLALDLLAGVVVLGFGDGVRVDDERAFLALADMGVELGRLLEGHPHRRREALLDRRGPQHQDVDARIGHAVVAQGAA